ncbi:hypothetical protein AB6A40_000102 [Gnathostoma spinigerum]|uniref:Uncharacterized protein n=1 Tax=Gnathostoma spinigerum TaxID=75299 RepID=A0ABD6E9L0_9BILA
MAEIRFDLKKLEEKEQEEKRRAEENTRETISNTAQLQSSHHVGSSLRSSQTPVRNSSQSGPTTSNGTPIPNESLRRTILMHRHCQGVSSVRREQTSRRTYVRPSGLERQSNSQPVVLNFDEPGGARIESTRVLRRRQRDKESFEAPRAKLSVNVIERLENCPSCSDASIQKKSISAENADEAHSSPSCAEDDVQPLEVDELPPVTHQVSNEHGGKENTNKNAHSLESEVKLE